MLRRNWANVVYPIISFVVLVIVWSLSIKLFQVPNYILPEPSAVLRQLHKGYVQGDYWPHVLFTLKNTAIGYFFGCSIAIVFGALLAESRNFDRFVYPFIIALQSMPKVALAPLIIVWFGFGMLSKVVMVALICFFPLFINTSVGIKQTPTQLIDMMRVFKASRLEIFFRVKLKSAMGHIFAGLQIGVVLSLIGAVVAEFVASTRGLGYLVSTSQANFDVATMFAALVGLIAIGITGTQLVRFFHSRVVFWEASGSSETIVSE
ncbi:ABC transporter permease [Ferrovibrio sp.]|uniref:ABC transporter permease n=1 Tax=Ferrovibrio sp. TaxID=1917215 RepID=UPI001B67B947|nr:ABC transporter permease [Ferrovibrio sp.]MBP7064825.1 ABC transporter permease [Ferrovibrio sp.]